MMTEGLNEENFRQGLDLLKRIQGPGVWHPEPDLIERVWKEVKPHGGWMIHDPEWHGFVMLVRDGDGMLLNPYFFGGVPVAVAGSDGLVMKLLKASVDLFRRSDQLRLSSVVYREMGCELKQQLLEAGGIPFDYDYVDMRCDLTIPMAERLLPEGVVVKPVAQCEEVRLKDCFDEAFSNSDVRYYQNLTHAEKLDFYKEVRMQGVMDNPLSSALIKDGQIIGFAFVYDYSGLPYITCMCMRPAYRGRGIGGYLLHRLKYVSALCGLGELGLGTEMEMRAYGLYRRAGFEIIRHRKYFTLKKEKWYGNQGNEGVVR